MSYCNLKKKFHLTPSHTQNLTLSGPKLRFESLNDLNPGTLYMSWRLKVNEETNPFYADGWNHLLLRRTDVLILLISLLVEFCTL